MKGFAQAIQYEISYYGTYARYGCYCIHTLHIIVYTGMQIQ